MDRGIHIGYDEGHVARNLTLAIISRNLSVGLFGFSVTLYKPNLIGSLMPRHLGPSTFVVLFL